MRAPPAKAPTRMASCETSRTLGVIGGQPVASAGTGNWWSLGDFEEESVFGAELVPQAPLELSVDLADAALGHAVKVADLAQRQLLDVEQHGHLALARRQLLEGA